MTKKSLKDVCLLWMLRSVCIVMTVFLLGACIQTDAVQLTTAPTDAVASTQTTSSSTPVPASPETIATSTPSAFIVVRERPSLSEALFVVLSKDQARLLAAYEGEADLQILYQFPTQSYRAQVTFRPADFPVISRDGVWVTVVENEERATSGIYRIPLVSPDEPTIILNWPGSLYEATISLDGERVAFLATESRCVVYEEHGESYSCLKHVYVMDSDGHNVKRLTTNAADRCFLTWSPNSTQLAYREVCTPAASLPPQVYVVTLEPHNTSKQVTQITASGTIGPYGQSTWSPSGEWLLWAADLGGALGGYRISRIDAEGKIVDEISSGLGESIPNGGVWSPDSKKLAGVARDNVLTIWNIESGKLTTVQLQDVWPFQPQRWLPDGERLVFDSLDAQGRFVLDNQWFMMNIDGTDLVEFGAP